MASEELPLSSTSRPCSVVSRSVLDHLFAGWRPELGISVAQSLYLIRVFLPRRSFSNLYFPVHDLLERSVLPLSDPRALHPGLLSVMYLVACAIVGGILKPHVAHFHHETRQMLNQSLVFADRTTHFLWASIVFGIWLGRTGYFKEAYVTMASTIRFAVGCGLAGPGGILPPPVTADDAVDRIHLVHAVYQVDRNLSMYTVFGSCLSSSDRWHSPGDGPLMQFQKALLNPLNVWPDVLSFEDATARLDPVLLSISRVSLLHERVDILASAIFSASNPRTLESRGLYGQNLVEFHSIRSDIASLCPILTSLWTVAVGDPPDGVQPNLTKFHATYYGTIILLYNMVVILHELGHDVPGVDVQDARGKTLEASEGLVGIADLALTQWNDPTLQPHAMLLLHFMNAVRVYVRELMRPSVKRSSQRVAIYCNSLSILMDILQRFLVRFPSWAHLAQPLRKVLPSSPNDIIFSKNAPDLRLSPALRAAL